MSDEQTDTAQEKAPRRPRATKQTDTAQEKAPEGMLEEARLEGEKYAAEVADDVAFAKRNGCPPPPKKNPQFGDKTPAYVEWLREHRSDRYEEKYGIERRNQRIPVHDDSGEVVRHEIKDVGRRKTHLSEKIERDPTFDESMDWDA